jgi:hypothetical protein|tara:strand:+ start:3411 stop:3695 length:285 start_codon:yes stop_codon:yes gene_type:complete
MVTESQRATEIVAKLNQWPDIWAVKYPGGAYGRTGVPDILLCHQGRFFGCELKTKDSGYEPTPIQEYQIEQIRVAGGVSGVVYSYDDVIQMLHG